MARKRPVEENPPPPASEEEGEEEVSEDEGESTDDDEEVAAENKTPAAAASHGSKALYSSETESDSESGSSSGRSSPSASAFQLKPVTPKAAKKPTPIGALDSEAAAAGKKKSAEVSGNEEEGEEGEDGRKSGRWSEADEIALLNGMIQFKSEKGFDPTSDLGMFVDYIQKSIQNKVSKSSLRTKLRRLKQKYQSLAEKGKNDGKDLTFAKTHDQKSFELSGRIWGPESEKSEKGSKQSKDKSSSSKVEKIGNGGGITLALPKQEPSNCLARSAKKPKRVSNGEVDGDIKKKSSGSSSNQQNGEVKVGAKAEAKKESKEEEMKDDEEEEDDDDDSEEEEEEEELGEKYPYLFASMKAPYVDEQVSKVFMKEVGKMDKAKLEEWESRWKTLKRSKLQLFIQQNLLMTELAKELADVV